MIVQPRKVYFKPQQKLKSSLKDIDQQDVKVKPKSKFYVQSQKHVSENNSQQKKNKNIQKNNNGQNICQQTYWGNIKPYFKDSENNCPRVCVSPTFVRSLCFNLLIIISICIALPASVNKNIPVQLMQSTPKLIAKKYLIFIYSGIWSVYQLIFLMILLLGNPGYGEPQSKKVISVEQQQDIINFPSIKRHQGFNKCQICQTLVDNSVYHCQICDICCQGFSHHCQYIGKCIGYRNEIYLNAYFYGFIVGLIVLVLIRMALFYL